MTDPFEKAKLGALIVNLADIEESKDKPFVDETTNEIVLPISNYGYRVDLDRCKDARDTLEWIAHLCGKTWIRPIDLYCIASLSAERNGFRLFKGV